jgi:predicted ATPase
MISEIQISNFKCFQSANIFGFSKINLLTGINGRGKSTILQSILIISQSITSQEKISELLINGNLIQLGNFDDIKNSETPRGSDISFAFKFKEPVFNANFSFNENEQDPLTAVLTALDITLFDETSAIDVTESLDSPRKSFEIPAESYELKKHVLFQQLSRIHYISANRLGPVKFSEKVSLPKFLNVGPRGEYTINILANDNLPLVNDILYLGNDANSVLQQTEEWLSYILEGAKIKIEGKEQTSSVLSLLINNKSNSYVYKQSNVGFGYSYILPLIVTGLIAKAEEVIIIENPEAHLHPRAQARIMEFFCKVASCGVQVFIESHSEHILNGIRVSALNPAINITSDDVSIQYFDEGFTPEKLKVDVNGKIANWPTGFFDQQEVDLSEIFKLTRK